MRRYTSVDVNLLLITFAFPPAGGVGVLRALSFAKYLPGYGVRVDVLTTRNTPAVATDPSLLAQVPDSVTVHRTWTLDLPFALRKKIKKMVSGRATASAKTLAPAQPGMRTRLLGSLRRLIGSLLLPDPQVGWLPFASRAARRLIRERQIDVVLVTVPPFSMAKLVPSLRETFPDLAILLDFRDEWLASTLGLWSFSGDQRAEQVAKEVEGAAVHACTRVIAVTRAAREQMIGRYPQEPPDKFVYLPNGFDDELTAKLDFTREVAGDAARIPDRLVLTYIGSVYASTDPGTLVEAVLSLSESMRSRFLFRFIGHIEEERSRELLSRLGPAIELRGFMPQNEALASMRETDYLLLISHDPVNVSAKFYDYLAGGKPILALVDPAGDIHKLIVETGSGIPANISSSASIAEALCALIMDAPSRQSRNTDVIAMYRRSVIARQLASLCGRVVSTR